MKGLWHDVGSSWMGNHFTNDDLVRESRLSDDFTCVFDKKPADEGSEGSYVIGCTPKPRAPVVWGKVTATVTPKKVPVKVDYYDEGEARPHDDLRRRSGRRQAHDPARDEARPRQAGRVHRIKMSDLTIGAEVPDSRFHAPVAQAMMPCRP
ncbi:MAG: outer membrane lipoprotein-sorting protein [Myxococcota bacterium]